MLGAEKMNGAGTLERGGSRSALYFRVQDDSTGAIIMRGVKKQSGTKV
jgi:hypothetical protein